MPRGRRRRNLDGSLPLSLLRACISFNLIMAPLDFEVPRRNGTELVICLLVKSGSSRSINLLASRARGRASEVRSAVARNKGTDVEWRIISPSKLLIIFPLSSVSRVKKKASSVAGQVWVGTPLPLLQLLSRRF